MVIGRYQHYNSPNLWFEILSLNPVKYFWCGYTKPEIINDELSILGIQRVIDSKEYILVKSHSFNNLYQKLNAG